MTAQLASVGIVGAGKSGIALATLLTEAGVTVSLGSRDPHSPRFNDAPCPVTSLSEAMQHETIVLSLPHSAIEATLAFAAPEPGAIVIDTANAVDFSTPGQITSALPIPHGRWLQRLLPQVRVTRAFSHVQDELLVSRAHRQPGTWAVAVAGDDDEAVDITSDLVHAASYVPVVIGDLDASAPLDPGGSLFPNMFLSEDMRRLVRAM
ncbi:MAG: NAD(P)-binding domain-containing protein [Microbacterium sp.]